MFNIDVWEKCVKKFNKTKIFKFVCLFIYIACVAVLIVEASMDGASSSSQSDAVGSIIAGAFNDISGDQTKAVIPTDVEITNTINQVKVGDSFVLSVKTTPENATYQSVNYYSSDESIATVDQNGIVNFIKEGQVELSVCNTEYTNLTDSLIVDVDVIAAQSIISTIDAVITDNGEYELYLGNQYVIETLFTPVNVTYDDLEYFVSDSSYLSVSSKGVITLKKYSANKTIEITIKHNDLKQIIKVHVEYENKIEIENIQINEFQIYETQTVTPNVVITPSDATFKDYVLLSSDSSILKVVGRKVTGVSSGVAQLTVKSAIYENICYTIDVNVLPQPNVDLNKTKVTMDSAIVVGETTKINVSKYPTYGLIYELKYQSSNSEVASVSSSGVITGKNAGSTVITITINGKDFNFPLTVNEKIDIVTTDMELETYLINLNCGNTYNLKDLIKVKSWVPQAPEDKNLTFTITDPSIGTISGSTLTLFDAGKTTINVTHEASGITKVVEAVVLYEFSISLNDSKSTSYEMSVGESFSFEIIDNQSINKKQVYHIYFETINGSLTNDNNIYTFKALSEGEIEIQIVPSINEEDYLDYSKKINVNVKNIYTSKLDISFNNQNGDRIIASKDGIHHIYLNGTYNIRALLSDNITHYDLSFNCSDVSVCDIEANGDLILYKVGQFQLTVTENCSNFSKTIDVYIHNYIKLDNEQWYTISGSTIKYLEEEKVYTIENGNSITLKFNFDSSSTYQIVEYSSNNEKVAKVGQDGVITPLRMGKCQITAVCYDGDLDPIELVIDLEIKPQDLIKDLSAFFYKVRKGIGHFGAFFVLGIFSTFTWLLFFGHKKMFFSVPVNIILGFGVALLTEIIQLYVPGRYGAMSDVMLDFSGFIISAMIITIGFIIHEIVTFIKNRKSLDTTQM